MKTRGDAFGRGCLWASLTALYGLLGMRVFVAWRDGLWLDWPLGDSLPDAVVRWVFAVTDETVRSVLAWLLRQDVLYFAAAVSLVLWVLTLSGESSCAADSDHASP